MFFRSYPKFNYNPKKDVISEWRRLCVFRGLDPKNKEDPKVKKSREMLRLAMVRQFNGRYGEDADSLEAWQELCRCVDIPVPDTLPECKKVRVARHCMCMLSVSCAQAIARTHVNLVDLTELRNGQTIRKFPTEHALSEYTRMREKTFPREDVEDGSLLGALLRHILNPSLGRRRGKGPKPPKRPAKS